MVGKVATGLGGSKRRGGGSCPLCTLNGGVLRADPARFATATAILSLMRLQPALVEICDLDVISDHCDQDVISFAASAERQWNFTGGDVCEDSLPPEMVSFP